MANVDYFLKIDGIDGESQDAKHKNEIDVLSFNWGEAQTGTSYQGGGSGAGKVQMHDFNFVMTVNKASPKLLLACANGQAIKSALLTCRKAGKDQQEFYKITMSDLLVSSFKTAGGVSFGGVGTGQTGADTPVIPVDNISLNYSTIKFDYSAQKPDGTLDGAITAGWNLKQNVAL